MTQSTYTNKLAEESSPYLLQHANNPVNWYPWGIEALEKAKRENKMLLISIGYSSCHWCHVMEHESFEKEDVAAIMNEHFVCIKVDREERPDIDQTYMDAVQLLTKNGGWPLNCFALPDGRPFYGGTYYRKQDWMNICERVAKEYREKPNEVIEFAQKLTDGIIDADEIELNEQDPLFYTEVADVAVAHWAKSFDFKDGGNNSAPKFPMPNNYQFLMRYGHLTQNFDVLKHVKLTLNKMAMGGIYDQLNGGFSRYATDMKWLIPHFEKMLYDNAQLLSVYAEGYQLFKNPLFKEVLHKTVNFCENELSNGNGIFYSALDADTDGEEGKFYTWTLEELEQILGADFELASTYFNLNENGYWSDENKYILNLSKNKQDFATENKISLASLDDALTRIEQKLITVQKSRTKPGLDDKSLTSWNGLMIKGLVDAFLATGNQDFIKTAEKTANFITVTQRMNDGGLFHTYKNKKSKIPGFLEDYAFAIEGLLALSNVTGKEHWLEEAMSLTNYTIKHFYNSENGMFYFTSSASEKGLVKKVEVQDNVIPASNSAMAKNLFYLGQLNEQPDYLNMAETMLNNVQNGIARYPQGFSNWGILMLHYTEPFYEVAISGAEAVTKLLQLEQEYNPNKIVAIRQQKSETALFKNRFVEEQTQLYVCRNKACQLPTTLVEEALKQLR